MSQPIPNNNLPIYLQKFSVDILAGAAYFSTVSLLPTNLTEKRVLNISLQGVASRTDSEIVIAYDFSKVDDDAFDITLEGKPVGTLQLGCKLLPITTKNVRYTYDSLLKILHIFIKNSKVQKNALRGLDFFLNLSINDNGTNCTCYACCDLYYVNYGSCTGYWGKCSDSDQCCYKNSDKDSKDYGYWTTNATGAPCFIPAQAKGYSKC